ncbi:hypothetical protein KXV64_007113, partial [Aspergillus fumigatus]
MVFLHTTSGRSDETIEIRQSLAPGDVRVMEAFSSLFKQLSKTVQRDILAHLYSQCFTDVPRIEDSPRDMTISESGNQYVSMQDVYIQPYYTTNGGKTQLDGSISVDYILCTGNTADIDGQDPSTSITSTDPTSPSDRYGDISIPSPSAYSNSPENRASKLVDLPETKFSQHACIHPPTCARSLTKEMMELAQGPDPRPSISDDDDTNPAEIPQALEYYDIHNNGRKGYAIRPVLSGFPPWTELQQLKSVAHRLQYEIGDIVYIYLGNSDSDGIALIREIRDLGDGRAMICVLWYAGFDEAVTYKCRNLDLWPRKYTHMVTNQLAVLMWDTAN